tara:strand:+ start:1341 stop:1709 length:369 start_codon:yes stop_codon:yes gene_type:complete
MAELKVKTKINVKESSVNVGDMLYYIPGANVAYNTSLDRSTAGEPTKVGVITEIIDTHNLKLSSSSFPSPLPTDGDLLMFAKPATISNNSLVGYFAEIKIKNDSTEKAELFTISSEITPSSK